MGAIVGGGVGATVGVGTVAVGAEVGVRVAVDGGGAVGAGAVEQAVVRITRVVSDDSQRESAPIRGPFQRRAVT